MHIEEYPAEYVNERVLIMCRLLGLIGPPPLPTSDVLRAFFPLSAEGHVKCTMTPGHLDGWGVSGYHSGRAVYFERRAEPAAEERALYDQAVGKAQRAGGSVVIAHFRKASAGTRELRNTHPFLYRDWIFAHNGTVYNAADMKLSDSAPQGETDSERLMLWLLEHVQDALDPTEALVNVLRAWRPRLVFSALNFLLTDGKTLWAYRDVGEKHLEPGETLEEREKYYTLYRSRLPQGAVVCSEPLKAIGVSWQPFNNRTLAVFTPKALEPPLIAI